MLEWLKKHVIVIGLIILFSAICLTVVVPFIIDKAYNMEAPFEFMVVSYDVNTLLNMYGDVLVLIGTVSLGAFTLIQNHLAQQKTTEVNKLTLELQRKSMQLAEERFNDQQTNIRKKQIPKFELRITGYAGTYQNIGALLINVSELYLSNLKSLQFKVIDKEGDILMVSDKVHFASNSMKSGSENKISFGNEELILKNSGGKVSMKNIKLEWSFQCEDQFSEVYYYRCTVEIEDSESLVNDLWEVNQVG